jgi:hypothetical protein
MPYLKHESYALDMSRDNNAVYLFSDGFANEAFEGDKDQWLICFSQNRIVFLVVVSFP